MKRLVFILLFLSICTGFARWEKCYGIGASEINSFTTNGNFVFAGTNSGFYFTSDTGRTWIYSGLKDYSVYSVKCKGNNILAGTDKGVYYSTDNGNSWILFGLEDVYIWELAIGTNDKIVAFTSHGLYVYGFNGDKWQLTEEHTWINSIALKGDTIFIGKGDGIFYSTNSGSNWLQRSKDCLNVRQLLINGNDFYSIMDMKRETDTIFNAIFHSTDYGESWTLKESGLESEQICSIVNDGDTIFTGTNGYIYKSTNKGDNWNRINPYTGIAYCRLSISGNIYLNGTSEGVYRSTDYGFSWSKTGINFNLINSIAIEVNYIYAGIHDAGVYLSTDNGTTWIEKNNGLNNTSVNTIITHGNNTYVGTMGGGVYLSIDNGDTWVNRNSGLTRPIINALAISGNNIYAGTDSGGVYVTTDDGTNWSNLGPVGSCINAIATKGDTLIAGSREHLYVSTDKGNSWNSVGLGPEYVWVNSIAVNGDNIFVGTGRGLYLSTDAGNSWEIKKGLNDLTVLSIAISGNKVFIGAFNGGVFLSTDNGYNWEEKNSGMDEVGDKSIDIYTLAISGDSIYAGSCLEDFFKKNSIVFKANINDFIAGIDRSAEESPIKIYPNPATDNISIELPTQPVINMCIRNYIGHESMVFDENSLNGRTTLTVDTEALPPGLYFVTFNLKNQSISRSFIVVR